MNLIISEIMRFKIDNSIFLVEELFNYKSENGSLQRLIDLIAENDEYTLHRPQEEDIKSLNDNWVFIENEVIILELMNALLIYIAVKKSSHIDKGQNSEKLIRHELLINNDLYILYGNKRYLKDPACLPNRYSPIIDTLRSTMLKLTLIFCTIILISSCQNESSVDSKVSNEQVTNDTLQISVNNNQPKIQETEDEIAQRYEDCCVENGSTVGIKDCIHQSTLEWEVEMEKYYELLLDTLDEVAKIKLIKSQEAWKSYAAEELEFSHEYYGNMDGTIWGIIGLSQTASKVKTRALELKYHYGAITGDVLKQ